jgi:hypothetical protein
MEEGVRGSRQRLRAGRGIAPPGPIELEPRHLARHQQSNPIVKLGRRERGFCKPFISSHETMGREIDDLALSPAPAALPAAAGLRALFCTLICAAIASSSSDRSHDRARRISCFVPPAADQSNHRCKADFKTNSVPS